MDAPSSASSEGNKDDLGEYVRSFPDPGLLHILSQETEFSNENGSLPNTEFRPGMHAINALRNAKVLVVGAGGLGCEVLVSLAISGFQYIVVIDYDRIELSNLNRQFLFREEHIGLCKSEVASNAIRTKFPKVECVPCTSRVQELPSTFFKDFTVVIGALDNLEARRELSAILVRNVSVRPRSDPSLPPEIDVSTIIPYIDGGTEGRNGQLRLIIPYVTPCFECVLDLYPPRPSIPLCTLQSRPRNPDHCALYALESSFLTTIGRPADLDDPDDLEKLFELSLEWAEQHEIEGVTRKQVRNAVRNVVPAVAATNAMIANAAVLETVKYVTGCRFSLHDCMSVYADVGCYVQTLQHERKKDCIICGLSRDKQ